MAPVEPAHTRAVLEPVDLDADGEAPDPIFAALQAAGIGDIGTTLEQLIAQRPAWHQRAACRGAGPELFFVERGGDPRPARELCAECPVVTECREAGTGERFGIWGGAGTVQRRRRPTAESPQLDTPHGHDKGSDEDAPAEEKECADLHTLSAGARKVIANAAEARAD